MAILMRRAAAGLSGCAETTLVNHTAKSVFRPDSPQPVGKGGIYKVGNPYQINGVWYYPKEDATYNETGIGSWYGDQFHGKTTANEIGRASCSERVCQYV